MPYVLTLRNHVSTFRVFVICDKKGEKRKLSAHQKRKVELGGGGVGANSGYPGFGRVDD